MTIVSAVDEDVRVLRVTANESSSTLNGDKPDNHLTSDSEDDSGDDITTPDLCLITIDDYSNPETCNIFLLQHLRYCRTGVASGGLTAAKLAKYFSSIMIRICYKKCSQTQLI